MQAVVGQGLPLGTRAGWGMFVIAVAAVDVLLCHLSVQSLGWRQHSWLSCDLRRRHAAERQLLQHILNRYRTLCRCCMHGVLISVVSALVLVAAGRAQHTASDRTDAGTAAGQAATAVASSAEDMEDPVHVAHVGVLVSVGLHVLPLLWLCTTQLAVHCISKRLELLVTATVAVAVLCPVSFLQE